MNKDLSNRYITSSVLLGRARLLDISSRKSTAFNEPTYLPFFFYLGRVIPATSLLEIGVKLGLSSACFLRGCSTVKKFLGIQTVEEGKYYSLRLAKANIRDCYKGNIEIKTTLDIDGKWDVVLLSEELEYKKYLEYMDIIWSKVNLGGLVVVDFLGKSESNMNAFLEFCKIKKREPVFFKSRYRAGAIER